MISIAYFRYFSILLSISVLLLNAQKVSSQETFPRKERINEKLKIKRTKNGDFVKKKFGLNKVYEIKDTRLINFANSEILFAVGKDSVEILMSDRQYLIPNLEEERNQHDLWDDASSRFSAFYSGAELYSLIVTEKIDSSNYILGVVSEANKELVPIYNHLGVDSINSNNEFVYEDLPASTYEVGIFNITEMNWIIPPKYKDVVIQNNRVLCRIVVDDKVIYDLYSITSNRASLLKGGVTSVDLEFLEMLSTSKRVVETGQPDLYKCYNQGSTNFIEFSFEKNGVPVCTWNEYSDSAYYNTLLTYNNSKLQINGEMLVLMNDSVSLSSGFVYDVFEERVSKQSRVYSDTVTMGNDVQLILKDSVIIYNERIGNSASGTPLLDRYSHCIIDSSTTEEIKIKNLANDFSGVYDRVNNLWIVPRVYDWILPVGEEYLAFEFFDYDGKEMFRLNLIKHNGEFDKVLDTWIVQYKETQKTYNLDYFKVDLWLHFDKGFHCKVLLNEKKGVGVYGFSCE